MVQYSNLVRTMGARDHSKNEASVKRLKRISIIFIFLAFIPFSYGVSQENKFVINVGGAKFLDGPFSYGMNNSPSFERNVNQ